MTPEIGELLDKARDCLARARIILAASSARMPVAMLIWRGFMPRRR